MYHPGPTEPTNHLQNFVRKYLTDRHLDETVAVFALSTLKPQVRDDTDLATVVTVRPDLETNGPLTDPLPGTNATSPRWASRRRYHFPRTKLLF